MKRFVAATSLVGLILTGTGGCKDKTNNAPTHRDTRIYTYKLEVSLASPTARRIQGTYYYGDRSTRFRADSGTYETTVTTVGPQRVSISGRSSKRVRCNITVMVDGQQVKHITRQDPAKVTCKYTP